MFAYLRHEAAHAHARRQPEMEPAPAVRGVRGFEGGCVTGRPSAACSRTCNTRQRTHARGASARDGAGASGGRARGFEGGCITVRPSAACSHSCDTRQRTHTRRASARNGAGASGAGRRGSRAVASPGVHLLHVRAPATRGRAHVGRQPKMEPAPAGRGAGVRGRLRHVAFICCMFAPLRHEAAHAHRGASATDGAGSRARRFEGGCITRRPCAACRPSSPECTPCSP